MNDQINSKIEFNNKEQAPLNLDILFKKSDNSNSNTIKLIEKNEESESNLIESENLKKARTYLFFSNLAFVISQNVIKAFFLYNSTSGKIVFGLYRNLGIVLFQFYEKFSDPSIEVKNLFEVFTYSEYTLYWLKLRVFCLIICAILVLLSIMHLKIAVSLCIFLLMPIFTNILATLVGGEKFQIKFLIACLISFIGTIIISVGKDQIDNYSYERNFTVGLIATLLYSFFLALLNITLKMLGKTIDKFNINYISSSFGILGLFIICIIYSVFKDSSEVLCLFDLIEILYAVGCGFIVGKSFSLMYESFKLADASKTSYITYIQLPVGMLIGYLGFGEVLNPIELIGCLIIVINVVIVTVFIN